MTSNGRDLGGYSVFFGNDLRPVAVATEAAVEREPESAPDVPTPPVPFSWDAEPDPSPAHIPPTVTVAGPPLAPPVAVRPDAAVDFGGTTEPRHSIEPRHSAEPAHSAEPEPEHSAEPGGPAEPEATTSAAWQLRAWDVTPAATRAMEEVVPMWSAAAEPGAEIELATWAEPAAAPAVPEAATISEPAVHIVEHTADLISMEFATSSVLDQISTTEWVKPLSSHGVRGAMNKLGFRFGLSASEERAERRRMLIRTQVTAPHQIAVLSVKGGVGRTTVTATLGSTFAEIRADRVAAVDASGGFGDLATRTRVHPQGLNFQDLVRGNGLDSFAAVQSFATTNAADLDVVASSWSSAADVELTAAEYAHGFATLRRHYNLLLADCGTALTDPATTAVLSASHAVLVVTSATVGGVSGAVATLNWLFSHGLRHLVAKAVVALVHQRPDHPAVDMDEVENIFASARRPTVVIPFDPHLAEGGEIDLRLLRAETRLAFEELAVDMVAHFPSYREVMR